MITTYDEAVRRIKLALKRGKLNCIQGTPCSEMFDDAIEQVKELETIVKRLEDRLLQELKR